ncbi:MAG: metal-dependent transcriptional regulator [Candidatus Heimdallarchaeota archaeon]
MNETTVDKLTITATIEDYLESILFISEEKGFAQVTEIADFLKVSKASVTEMVSKLKKHKLVQYEKYGTITLTEEGNEIAEKVKKRHEIWKTFLTLIGVKSEIANIDCCLLEHNLSKETITNLERFIVFLKDEKQRDVLERYKNF